jgi:hypothetical protein
MRYPNPINTYRRRRQHRLLLRTTRWTTEARQTPPLWTTLEYAQPAPPDKREDR